MPASTMTIDDIAEALGVSKTTVSRAISGKGRISKETTDRVQRYIEEHNYKPSAMARGLAKQKTYNVGVVCPTDYEIFDFPFFHTCLRGISEVTTANGYDILISMVDEGNLSNLKRIVEGQKVDGMILTRTLFEDPLSEYLKEVGIPFVTIGSSPDDSLVTIDNDHFQGCMELTGVLLAKGMKHLALIGCDEQQIITDTRRRGFLSAHHRAGMAADPSLLYMDAVDERRVATILEDLRRRGADGVICMDEKITGFLLGACRKLHIRIPEDLKVASFYNSQAIEVSNPPVTSLDVDDRQLGNVAAGTLLEMIRGGKVERQQLRNYQIILRESTS